MTTKLNRALRLEEKLKHMKCPTCKTKGRLMQRKPGNYSTIRCMECGAMLRLK